MFTETYFVRFREHQMVPRERFFTFVIHPIDTPSSAAISRYGLVPISSRTRREQRSPSEHH